MPKLTKEYAALTGTLGPGGRGGGPRRIQKILLFVILIEASLLLLLEFNYLPNSQIIDKSRANE